MSKRTRILLGTGVVLTLVAAMLGAGLVLGPTDADASAETTDSTSDAGTDTGTSSDGTETAAPQLTEAVVRSDLIERKDEVGAVGHGDTWPAPIESAGDGQGIVTERHDKGTTVDHGEPLIWINNRPVTLAEGTTPLYRTLELVGTTKSKHLSGDDVTQLQEFLIEAGFDDKGRLEPDGVFGKTTRNAVKAWQKETGLEETGRVDRSQLVFHPDPLRIDTAPRVGSTFQDLQVSAAAQKITVQFDNKSGPFLAVGATVTLDPDGDPSQGTITEVTSGIDESTGSQTLNATIEPNRPLPDGTEKVKVEVTRVLATDALVVPVRAVLALSGGGYGLEVSTPQGPELRAVELGAVVDDTVEITGDFAEGDEVVVPNDRFGAEG